MRKYCPFKKINTHDHFNEYPTDNELTQQDEWNCLFTCTFIGKLNWSWDNLIKISIKIIQSIPFVLHAESVFSCLKIKRSAEAFALWRRKIRYLTWPAKPRMWVQHNYGLGSRCKITILIHFQFPRQCLHTSFILETVNWTRVVNCTSIFTSTSSSRFVPACSLRSTSTLTVLACAKLQRERINCTLVYLFIYEESSSENFNPNGLILAEIWMKI